MTRTELLSRISINPNICFGKPCIRGHRIWVSLILDCLASGWTVQDILDEYPGLEEADAWPVSPMEQRWHASAILRFLWRGERETQVGREPW